MTTFLLSLLMIIDILVVLMLGAATLPAKVIMKTMPQELQEAAKNHPNPPMWKMIIGFSVYATGIVLALWIFYYAGYDGIRQGWGFWKIFIRYMIILYSFKLFDIVCLDWWLITKSHFFQHFFPETKESKGYNSFGFNKKEQIMQIIMFPFACVILAALWVWLG